METASAGSGPRTWYSRSIWLSAAELLVGAFFVIGYNVFHVVPNEVPILFVLGMVSLRIRDGDWGAMGLRRPGSWPRTVLIALAAAVVRIALGGTGGRPDNFSFLARRRCPGRSRIHHWQCGTSAPMARAGLDVGCIRRGDRLPRLSDHSRGGLGRTLKTRILVRHFDCVCPFRVWALL